MDLKGVWTRLNSGTEQAADEQLLYQLKNKRPRLQQQASSLQHRLRGSLGDIRMLNSRLLCRQQQLRQLLQLLRRRRRRRHCRWRRLITPREIRGTSSQRIDNY